MKFLVDKATSTSTWSCDEMEFALKKELEATKCALKLQTLRCRQLVAAFTKKLYEKEQELKASQSLRDQQLGRLLRALLVLESRLKKEQKLIRLQLQEKDMIIRRQEKEICKFKSETDEKWHFPVEAEAKSSEKNWRVFKSELSLGTGEERLDNLCKGLLHNTSVSPRDRHSPKSEPKETGLDISTSEAFKKEKNSFKDNPVLESVNQILLRDEEDLLNVSQPVSSDLGEKALFTPSGDSPEWYETNSNSVVDDASDSEAWRANRRQEGETAGTKIRKDAWPGEKASSVKCQLLEEKACLEMAKKNLIVVDLEEVDGGSSSVADRAASPAKSTASYEEINPVSKSPDSKPFPHPQKPPALPPKPARLLKPSQILNRNQDPGPPFSCRPRSEPPASNSSSGKKQSRNGFGATSGTTRHRHPQSKSENEALDFRPKPPDSNSKPKRHSNNMHVSGSTEMTDRVTATHFVRPKTIEESSGHCNAIKIGSSVSSLITGLSGEKIVTELGGESAITPDDSHVSQLVRQFEILGKQRTVASERSEDEVNDIRQNFEEFKLEESFADNSAEGEGNGRHDGDGAENRNSASYYAALAVAAPLPGEPSPAPEPEHKMYEAFLENTGLSQKSILTPSRMLSNHRSCLKPKDVKHRSRIKAAAAIEKCNLNSTVKYWTEPFL